MNLARHVAGVLAYFDQGDEYEGFTVVENRKVDATRWEAVMELVVRDDKDWLWRSFYYRGLTEDQDIPPFEHLAGDEVEFKPVYRKVVESYDYEDIK